ncbi:MAG: DUF5790 family protein [Halobacteriales archaeon]
MAQSSFDDEDLFTEASGEMKEDVESNLEAARRELPSADDILETEAGNVVGVLNGLKSSLDAGEAEAALREARKWLEIGRRADAFDDDFVSEAQGDIDEVGDVLEALERASTSATELMDAVATLKQNL